MQVQQKRCGNYSFRMATYKDHITAAMDGIFSDPNVVGIGYNMRYGRAAGTLNNVKEEQLLEMPLAENLMMGAAVGMSLGGFIPFVYFERMDFVLCALDALVNHLDKLKELSDGMHKPACIIRCVVGNKDTPLFTGKTHTQNFSKALREMVSFQVLEMHVGAMIPTAYSVAYRNAKAGNSTILVDFKDLWNT